MLIKTNRSRIVSFLIKTGFIKSDKYGIKGEGKTVTFINIISENLLTDSKITKEEFELINKTEKEKEIVSLTELFGEKRADEIHASFKSQFKGRLKQLVR